VLLTHSGGAVASFGDHGFDGAQPIELGSLFSGTDDDAPLALRFLYDLDGDGRLEAVLPNDRGVVILHFEPAALGAAAVASSQVLESPPRVRYRIGGGSADLGAVVQRAYAQPVSAEATAPAIFVEDFDGDGRSDVITLTDMRLRVFTQDEAGHFATQPSLDIERSVLSQADATSEFTGEALSFADLNGDAVADLVVLKWGSSEERTQMDRHVFFARPGPSYPQSADQIVRSESLFPDFEMRDLNGDGRRDLVIPYFHVAPSQAFKMLTQNELRVQLRLFLMRDDGRYPQDPGKAFAKIDHRIVLDYHLDVIGLIFGSSGAPRGRFAPLLTMRGDYNGDGYADLLFDGGRDALNLYWGNADGRYAKSPDLSIEYESAFVSDVVDLNGDGKSDIVTYYGKRSSQWRASADEERFDVRKRRRQRALAQRERAAAQDGEGEEREPESRVKMLISR
jgi:hypothetical protein